MALDKLAKDPLYNFVGVNLRKDNLSLADGDMARAVNYDLHLKPGVLILRKGHKRLHVEAFNNPVRQVARHNGQLYHVAGSTLYRNFLSALTDLDTARIVSMAAYRPLNDTTSWTFLAQRETMQKDNGSTMRLWGIRRPSIDPVAAVGSAGSLTGSYRAKYTYARVVGSAVAHESNPSTPSNAVSLTSDEMNVDVTASPDDQVTHIRLYRTQAGGSLYLFDQMVANTTATLTSTQADTALGAAVEDDNDLPPQLAYVAEYQSHFFGVGDPDHLDYLWYAKRFRPEAWPDDQFLRIGADDDPLQVPVRMAGFLGVFSRKSKYRVSGNAASGFAWAEALNTRGTMCPHAIVATSSGVLFWARDGIFLTNFLQVDQELSRAIAPLFESGTHNGYEAINWNMTGDFSLAEYKRRLYAGYRDVSGTRMIAVYSQDTGQWYHYQHPCRTLYYDETEDQLLMGTNTGYVAVIEVGASDNEAPISGNAQTRTMSGIDRFVRKNFAFLKLDCEAVGDGGTVKLYIDDTLIQTVSVTAQTRTTLRRPIRLTDVQGYGWHLVITGSVQMYGATMLYSVFEEA